jgi:hypothetical protein
MRYHGLVLVAPKDKQTFASLKNIYFVKMTNIGQSA